VAGGPSSSDPRLEGTWHLASGSDDGDGLPIGAHSITLTIGDSTHTGGDEPCGAYDATVTGGIGPIFVTVALTSGMRDACTTTDLTHLEQLYVGALGASRFAAIDEGALVLTSPHSNLVFLRSVPAPIADIRNTNWRLYAVGTQVPSVTSVAANDPVRLKFSDADQFTLSSRCMTMDGDYQLEGENFAINHTTFASEWCRSADRILTGEAVGEFDGPLLLDVTAGGPDLASMLVVTNLHDNLPIVFRADN
jgi:hypothetical protein